MKKYLLTILLFLIPVVCLMVIEVLLPPTFFTFRTWEGISFATKIPHHSAFYPDSKTNMYAAGDLCHHTNKAIMKSELWITDKLGFRNNEFVQEADVLFIGDSYTAGSGLSQQDIISNKLKAKINPGVRVYNMSPGTFSQFDYYLKTGILKKPKLIIFSIVERIVPEPIIFFNTGLIKKMIYKIVGFGNSNVYIDRAFRFSSMEWLKARINNSKGLGLPSKGHPDMYFLQGSAQKHKEDDLQKTVVNIVAYKKFCDSLNIKFVFVPMPDKETVYYEFVPFVSQPDYLFQLDSLLKIRGVSVINTLKIYNDYRKFNDSLLYHPDDTHWNANATELMADSIRSFILQNGLISM